jgi:hypothetical protein
MLGKKKQQIKDLKAQLDSLQWEMYDVASADTDPDMKSYHLGELQCIEMSIEEEIESLEHEIAMFPLKLMLVGFIVSTVGLFIYYFQKL